MMNKASINNSSRKESGVKEELLTKKKCSIPDDVLLSIFEFAIVNTLDLVSLALVDQQYRDLSVRYLCSVMGLGACPHCETENHSEYLSSSDLSDDLLKNSDEGSSKRNVPECMKYLSRSDKWEVFTESSNYMEPGRRPYCGFLKAYFVGNDACSCCCVEKSLGSISTQCSPNNFSTESRYSSLSSGNSGRLFSDNNRYTSLVGAAAATLQNENFYKEDEYYMRLRSLVSVYSLKVCISNPMLCDGLLGLYNLPLKSINSHLAQEYLWRPFNISQKPTTQEKMCRVTEVEAQLFEHATDKLPCLFHCKFCSTPILDSRYVASGNYRIVTGRAFLVSGCHNVKISEKTTECNYTTGVYTVRDVNCAVCDVNLGIRYVDTDSALNTYKIGKYLIAQYKLEILKCCHIEKIEDGAGCRCAKQLEEENPESSMCALCAGRLWYDSMIALLLMTRVLNIGYTRQVYNILSRQKAIEAGKWIPERGCGSWTSDKAEKHAMRRFSTVSRNQPRCWPSRGFGLYIREKYNGVSSKYKDHYPSGCCDIQGDELNLSCMRLIQLLPLKSLDICERDDGWKLMGFGELYVSSVVKNTNKKLNLSNHTSCNTTYKVEFLIQLVVDFVGGCGVEKQRICDVLLSNAALAFKIAHEEELAIRELRERFDTRTLQFSVALASVFAQKRTPPKALSRGQYAKTAEYGRGGNGVSKVINVPKWVRT